MKKTIKIIAIVAGTVICGILYSCSRNASIKLGSDEAVIETESRDGESEKENETDSDIVTETGTLAEAFEQEIVDPIPETGTETDCYVYVCGAVCNPGVYVLSPDARVVDAIQAAGGFSEEADKNYLNLAGVICDGLKIYVPTEKEVKNGYNTELQISIVNDRQKSVGQENDETSRININTADETELMKLKGVGKSRARDIIEYRNANGVFKKIEDIMQVPGIKEGMFKKIKNDIEV